MRAIAENFMAGTSNFSSDPRAAWGPQHFYFHGSEAQAPQGRTLVRHQVHRVVFEIEVELPGHGSPVEPHKLRDL
jgi:hypothetical protein